jgi:hypothetical protein
MKTYQHMLYTGDGPWHSAIQSDAYLICEVKSFESGIDAERRAKNICRSLEIASAAEEMCAKLCGKRHIPNCPVDLAGGAEG